MTMKCMQILFIYYAVRYVNPKAKNHLAEQVFRACYLRIDEIYISLNVTERNTGKEKKIYCTDGIMIIQGNVDT